MEEIVSILAEAGYIVEIEIVKEDFPIYETYFVNIYEKEEREMATK